MNIWTPTCNTHGTWNASREAACPKCMATARKRIARLEGDNAALLAACKAVWGVFQDSEDPPMYARRCRDAIAKQSHEESGL